MSREDTAVLNSIRKLICSCLERMDARYGRPVFDEWAIVSLCGHKGRVLVYSGPRKDGFQRNFLSDIGSLREGLLTAGYSPGDFEFEREGVGTGFESFLVLGDGLFLICNNTSQTMDLIARDPLWISAQIPFVELSEQVRANPVEFGEMTAAR